MGNDPIFPSFNGRTRIVVLLVVGAAVCASVLYYRIDPGHSIWAPKCMFRFFTGWDCPACGGQRALHAALHGRWAAAVRYNPFLLISLPYFCAVAYTTFSTSRRAQYLKCAVQHPWAIKTYVILFFGWWIVRNTSWWIGQG